MTFSDLFVDGGKVFVNLADADLGVFSRKDSVQDVSTSQMRATRVNSRPDPFPSPSLKPQ
jgi:hypothetical protein